MDKDPELMPQPDGESFDPAAAESGVSKAREEPCNCGRPGGICVCSAPDHSNPSENAPVSYVYLIGGAVRPVWRTQDAAVEFTRVRAQIKTNGMTDAQADHAVLSTPEHRYLLREVCPMVTIPGYDGHGTHFLRTRDADSDLEALAEAFRPRANPLISAVGSLGKPMDTQFAGLPTVDVDVLYVADLESLIKSIPKPHGMTATKFEPVATELFKRITRSSYAGLTDGERVMNCAALTDLDMYALAVGQYERDFSLVGVECGPSIASVGGGGNVMELVMKWVHRPTGRPEEFVSEFDAGGKYVSKHRGWVARIGPLAMEGRDR